MPIVEAVVLVKEGLQEFLEAAHSCSSAQLLSSCVVIREEGLAIVHTRLVKPRPSHGEGLFVCHTILLQQKQKVGCKFLFPAQNAPNMTSLVKWVC